MEASLPCECGPARQCSPAWRLFLDRPLTGWGTDCFRLAFGRHRSVSYWRIECDGTPAKVAANEQRTGRRRVPYMLIAPEDPEEIGRIAVDVYRRHYGRPQDLLRSFDLAGLGHLVSAERNANHGELLSYLFFAPEFAERLIELGRRDAERWLDAPHDDGRWQLGPLR